MNDLFPLFLRVGLIESVEDHSNADKLFVLNISFGDEKRVIVSGIKDFYSKDDLINKKLLLFVILRKLF